MSTILSPSFRFQIFLFFRFAIPMLGFAKPKIHVLDESKCILKIPLSRRTKNHLGSMYFGALCMGAEMSAGILAIKLIRSQNQKIDMVFKDIQANFVKRADGDTYFVCECGDQIRQMIDQARHSSDRVEQSISGFAYVHNMNEPVMEYRLTISVKNRSKSKGI
ncbi:MAG: DUF4442 domain-containing protein [Bdellovibrionota bacterium]